jgi:hypothetical protein
LIVFFNGDLAMAFEENPEDVVNGSDPGAMPGQGEGAATPSPASTVNDMSTLLPNISDDGFQRDSQGQLVMSADGVTPRKKPGRKKGQTASSIGTSPNVAKAPKTAAEKKAMAVSSEQIARHLINTTTSSLAAMIGDEWHFQSQEEADGMRSAVTAYIEAKGDAAFTPDSMMAIVLAGYAMPRFGVENTRSKFKRFFGSIAFWRKS